MLIGLPRGVACATCAPGGHPRHLRGVADGWGEPPEAPALRSRWVGWSSGGSIMNNRWVGCATRRQLRVPHAEREVAECALRVADSCMMPLLHPPKKIWLLRLGQRLCSCQMIWRLALSSVRIYHLLSILMHWSKNVEIISGIG